MPSGLRHLSNACATSATSKDKTSKSSPRYADADSSRLPALAIELVTLQPDLIVALDPPATVAARKATASIPIVSAILNDPVRLGLIASYARPGGNVTGILSQVEGLPGKQVEIVQQVVPAANII